MTGRFYVYAHYTADTGRLFYIGKGSGYRARSRNSRNRRWRAIVAKHGVRVEFLADGLSEDQAYFVEAGLIAEYGTENRAAYASGGRGISGYRHTDEARQSMSRLRAGRRLPPEQRARLSKTIRSRPDLMAQRTNRFMGESNPAKAEANRQRSRARMRAHNPMADLEVRGRMIQALQGRRLSTETRAKLSAALKGRKRGPMPEKVREVLAAVQERRKRPVVTTCGLWFESTLAAAKALGLRQGNIVNNCAGRAKSAGGYSWSYADGPR